MQDTTRSPAGLRILLWPSRLCCRATHSFKAGSVHTACSCATHAHRAPQRCHPLRSMPLTRTGHKNDGKEKRNPNAN